MVKNKITNRSIVIQHIGSDRDVVSGITLKQCNLKMAK